MVKKLQSLKAKKGFTLVELIVVIAIIGVLAAILVPTMMGMVEKSKVTSLDSTASTIVEAVNAWIADRYTNGVSGGLGTADASGIIAITSDAKGVLPSEATAGDWSVKGAVGNNTSLNFAIQDAYNFSDKDYIKIFFKDGKCVGAAYKQNGKIVSGVSLSASGTWSGVVITNAKDGVVNETDSNGAMIGTYPKCKSTST